MVFKDYYKILELKTNKVTTEEIKNAYRNAVKKNHPDLNLDSRLAEEKNVTFLIENQKELIKHNKKCKLMIIGDGPDKEMLMNQAKELNVDKNVIFTGKIPWEEIHEYYQMANIFVSASNTETQGLTLLEAMAAGVPVVALDDEAFRDVVVDDLNGYLFKDDKGYISSINKLMDDKKLYNRMSKQARINGEAHSSKYYAEKVLDVYNMALKGESTGDRSFSSRMKNVIRKGLRGE